MIEMDGWKEIVRAGEAELLVTSDFIVDAMKLKLMCLNDVVTSTASEW